MAADELHEGDLPTEIEGNHEPIVSSGNLESHPLAVEDFGFGCRRLDFVGRDPTRSPGQFVPPFERNLRFRVSTPKIDEHISRNDPHTKEYTLFPIWEQASGAASKNERNVADFTA
jgi:hypothetical protein